MIFLGSDHAGYELKEKIKLYLTKTKIEFTDLGTNSNTSVDYPIYAKKVCNEVLSVPNSKGFLFCGTGIGMCIVANRNKGIRAASPFNIKTAKLSRSHNDANVLCLGGRIISYNKALRLVKTFLNTQFEAGRHAERLEQIDLT